MQTIMRRVVLWDTIKNDEGHDHKNTIILLITSQTASVDIINRHFIKHEQRVAPLKSVNSEFIYSSDSNKIW